MFETQLLDALLALALFIAAGHELVGAHARRASLRTGARMLLFAATFLVLAMGSKSPGLALLSAAGLTWVACFAI